MGSTSDRWGLRDKPGREYGSPSVSEILQEINDNCSLLEAMNKVKRDYVRPRDKWFTYEKNRPSIDSVLYIVIENHGSDPKGQKAERVQLSAAPLSYSPASRQMIIYAVDSMKRTTEEEMGGWQAST
jgi:hypothetical protein